MFSLLRQPIAVSLPSLAAVVLAAGFLLLFAWFQAVQPFDNFFFEASRAQLLAHIAARILLLPYIFCILFGLGHMLMKMLTAKTGKLPVTPMEEIAIAVLAGSAVLRLAMLALGFAGLYYSLPLALAGAAAIAAGGGRLFTLLREMFVSLKAAKAGLSKIETAATAALLAAIVFSIGAVLVQKYLYPFTRASGDYLSHYLPYYLEVIERRNLWPNDVWYHFYVSKAAGDFIYTIMMSDALGPGAVNMTMHTLGILIGYAFLKRMTQDRLVSLLGTAVLAGAFIYTYEFPTPSAEHSQFNEPWGTFDREHPLTSVLIFGGVWAGWLMAELTGNARRVWWKLSALSVLALMLLRPQAAVFYGLPIGALWLWALARRDYGLAWSYMGLAAVAGGGALAVWAFNIMVTGLGDVSPFLIFWKIADQEKLAQWVGPFMGPLTLLGSSPNYGDIALPHLDTPLVPTLISLLRLNKILPYFALFGLPFLFACAAAAHTLRYNRAAVPRFLASGLFALGALLLASLILFFCVHQIHSQFRFYTFCVYPVALLGIAPFAMAAPFTAFRPRYRSGFAVIAALLGVLAVHGALASVSNTYSQLTLNFLYRKEPLGHVIEEQQQLFKPDLCPYVEKGSRLWWLNAWGPNYMSPRCTLQTFNSYSMGPDWAVIMFDKPELAAAALKKQRIDYFLMDTTKHFFDLLPFSPLFSPRHIGKHLQTVWAKDGIYLLTWPSAHTKPLTPRFFTDYRAYIKKSADYYAGFGEMHRQLAALYAKWKLAPHFPIELDPTQPKPRGWQ